jgi:Ca2+-binding EF-hand superfamily protein
MDEREAETARKQVNAAQRRSGLSWEKVFAEADADGSGTLTQAELKQVIREKLGLRSTINDHDVKALFEHVDCDCSGSIELEELLDYMRTGSVQDDSDEANLVKNAKRVERVQQAISLAFSKISSNEADIRKLFHDIDPDGDGTLSEFEFMGFVRDDLKLSIWNCKKKDLMAFYHYLDKDGDGLDVDDLVDYVCRGEAGAYLKDRQEKPRGFGAALGPMADAEKELGNAEFKKGNYDQAIVHFTNAGAPGADRHLRPTYRQQLLKDVSADYNMSRKLHKARPVVSNMPGFANSGRALRPADRFGSSMSRTVSADLPPINAPRPRPKPVRIESCKSLNRIIDTLNKADVGVKLPPLRV